MAITNGYATLTELKRRLRLDDQVDDAVLETAVNAASRWIDQRCNRHFWKTAAGTARVFEPPCDRRELRLGEFNDLAVLASLKTDDDGDGTFEVTWTSSDFTLLPLTPAAAPEERPYTAIRAVDRSFPSATCTGRPGRIEITGTWGWPAVPADVHEACLIQASRIFKRRDSPEGVTGWGSDYGPIRVTVKADPDVVQMLAPYQLTAVLVA